MGGRRLFFHTFTNYCVVMCSRAVSCITMNWKQSHHCDNWKKQRKKKVTERCGGHNRQLKLKHIAATCVDNEIHIWRVTTKRRHRLTVTLREKIQRRRGTGEGRQEKDDCVGL